MKHLHSLGPSDNQLYTRCPDRLWHQIPLVRRWMNKDLYEGRNECWRGLKLSSDWEAIKPKLEEWGSEKDGKQEEKRQRNVEDIGAWHSGKGSELAGRRHRFCQTWCLACCMIFTIAFTMTLKVSFSLQISKFPDLNNRRCWLYQSISKAVMGEGSLGNYVIRKGSSWPKRLGPALRSSLNGTAFLGLGLGIPIPALIFQIPWHTLYLFMFLIISTTLQSIVQKSLCACSHFVLTAACEVKIVLSYAANG